MSLLLAWVVCPLLLAAWCVGLGLLAERATGAALPRAVLPGLGLAGLVVVAQAGSATGLAAGALVALLAGLAVAGYAVAGRARLQVPSPWPVAAATAVFTAYAAPIVVSGEATFAGYGRLDDTATWLAIADHVLEHGRDVSALAPSTHEATLAYTLGRGYPVGAFLPLAVLATLSGQDVAWLIQPYMATVAAILGLGLWALAAPLRATPGLRALVAFTAGSAALLYGHYLWGGVKEVLAAALVATAAALAAAAVRGRLRPRIVLAVALVALAMASSLSLPGMVWLAPPAAALAAAVWRSRPWPAWHWVAGALGLAGLAATGLALGGWLSPTRAAFTAGDELGGLLRPLPFPQIAGVWPAGDFRLRPHAPALAFPVVAVVAAAAVGGFAVAWQRRAAGAVLYAAGALLVAAVAAAGASPWVASKAMAIASPAILLCAGIGAATTIGPGRRAAGVALLAAVVGGVLWSNALAYRDASLAPRDRLAELERLGERIAGQGPTLMTEYEPYGARHFLREAEAEGASELRRRQIPLRGGGVAEPGEAVDVDDLQPRALRVYRTLVLPRAPLRSSPPPTYELVHRGEHYEAWQRAPGQLARFRP